jgi:beta-lactamase regulating signal transducer with metallopeptidase domain
MTTAVFEFANSFIFEAAWKSTVILGIVILAGKLLKRQSASFKRIVYSTGILAMLCFILTAPISPRWTINAPDFSTLSQTATAPESQNFQSEDIIGEDHFSFVPVTILPFFWLLITLFLLGKLTVNLFSLRRLRRTSSLENGDGINFLVQEIAGKLGREKRFVTILRNETVEMPVTWGIFRHFILLPKDFEKLSAENCRVILIHELAHIKRLDFVNRIFAEVLCAVLWFQPLAWTLRKNLKEAQERAADDCVLEMGEKASGYARLLLEWNERLSGKNFSLVPGAVEQKGLKSRLEAILNPETRRRPMTFVEISVICLIIFGLAIPLIGMKISQEVKPLAAQNLNVQKENDLTQKAKVSEAKAIETANGFQPGTVLQVEFGQTDEGVVYKILIRDKDSTKGNVTRLTIDAIDGRIIKTWRGVRKSAQPDNPKIQNYETVYGEH